MAVRLAHQFARAGGDGGGANSPDDTRLLAEGVRGMEEAGINSRALRGTMDILVLVEVWLGIMRYM